ncbi:MAG: CBS domain-containing protein [Gammaproteobacteria bacterium]|nr:MAG: CBS domain-containing protein [Gammaproteobacteria bacterium]
MDIKTFLNAKGGRLITITPDANIVDAVALMMQHRIGSLPVVEDGQLVSIITERDILFAVNNHLEELPNLKVRAIMAKDIVTCDASCKVADAMNLMFDNRLGRRIRHLPILEEGKLVGVVSNGDLLNALLDQVSFENRIMKNYIKNWPEETA